MNVLGSILRFYKWNIIITTILFISSYFYYIPVIILISPLFIEIIVGAFLTLFVWLKQQR